MKEHIQNFSSNQIWMLEHDAVFTLGTAADESHIINAGQIPVIQTDRGGEVTYHGPGQLVIYFLIDIKEIKLGPKVKYFLNLSVAKYPTEPSKAKAINERFILHCSAFGYIPYINLLIQTFI